MCYDFSMNEGFSTEKFPDAAAMRAQIYEMESKRIKDKLGEIDNELYALFAKETTGEVPDNSIDLEVHLLNATKEELEKQLEKLQSHYENGR